MTSTTNLKVRQGDRLSSRRHNSLVDRLPQNSGGSGTGLKFLDQTQVPIIPTVPVDAGQVLVISDYQGPSTDSELENAGTHTMFDAEPPVWHSKISRLAVALEAQRATETADAAIFGSVVAKINSPDDSKEFVMIDPADPGAFKSATGGVGRLLAVTGSNHGIVRLHDGQEMWRYSLKEEVQNDGTYSADLLELDDAVYATDIQLVFRGLPSIGVCMKVGEKGYCFLAGNEFYALTSASALMGEPVKKNVWDDWRVVCIDNQICVQGVKSEIHTFTCEDEPSPGQPPEHENAYCIAAQFAWECWGFCEYLCYCENYSYDMDAYPDNPCAPCVGECWWKWSDPGSTGNGQWIPDPDRPNTCTENIPNCDCYGVPDFPPPYSANNPPPHNFPHPDPTPCGLPPPECEGNCYWTYRQGSFSTTSGTKFFNYWESSGNDCRNTTNPEDCGCCLPPDNVTDPQVDQTYPIPCDQIPTCAGTCSYYWDAGNQDWNLIPELTYCCGTDPANCLCGVAPSNPPADPQDDGFIQEVPCGGEECTGFCDWIYRVGLFTTASGETYDFNYWEPAGNNCRTNGDPNECGCCLPPTGIPTPEVNRTYRIACTTIPDCAGACQWYWDAVDAQWVKIPELDYCCGTDPLCECGAAPTDPGAADGDLSDPIPCGPGTPPTHPCCDIEKRLEGLVYPQQGPRYAELHQFAQGFCEINFLLDCYHDGDLVPGGPFPGKLIYETNLPECEGEEFPEDDGKWRIEFTWPVAPNPPLDEQATNCGCCQAEWTSWTSIINCNPGGQAQARRTKQARPGSLAKIVEDVKRGQVRRQS